MSKGLSDVLVCVCGLCFAVYYSTEIEEQQYKKLDAQDLCQASRQFIARSPLRVLESSYNSKIACILPLFGSCQDT